jgi:hypothetical protein
MQINVDKDRLIDAIRLKLYYQNDYYTDEMIEKELAFLQASEPEQILSEKFTLTTDEEILAPLLPFGTEFSVGFDCEFNVTLYDNKLFTQEQFESVNSILSLPSSVRDVRKEDLFIEISSEIANFKELWCYIESIT